MVSLFEVMTVVFFFTYIAMIIVIYEVFLGTADDQMP